MVWQWLPLPFLLGSPFLLAAALAKSHSSCLSLPLLASRVVLPQHPECTMLISFHLTRPLNNLFITYSSVTSLSVPCASCQDRKTKTLAGKRGEFWAQFSSVQFNSANIYQARSSEVGSVPGTEDTQLTQTRFLPVESSLLKGRQNLRMQGDDGTWGNTGSAGGTAVPGVVGNSSFPEKVT